MEFLWTKISLIGGVPMPFGTDLNHEDLKELLVGRGESINGKGVFKLSERDFSEKDLVRPGGAFWEPRQLSAAAVDMAKALTLQPRPLKLDLSLSEFLRKKHGVVLDDAVAELVGTHAYCRTDTELRPIGHDTLLVIREDGTGYADLNTVRLSAWCGDQGFEFAQVDASSGDFE